MGSVVQKSVASIRTRRGGVACARADGWRISVLAGHLRIMAWELGAPPPSREDSKRWTRNNARTFAASVYLMSSRVK